MNLRPVLPTLGVLAVVGLAVAFDLYLRPVIDAASEVTGQVVPRGTNVPASGIVVRAADEAEILPDPPPASATPMPEATPAVVSPSGSRRTNILLLGSDTDAKFKGAYNSQIMIVASIDPINKQVSLLSLPRDLWVPIPGAGTGKLGSAMMIGGIALTRETVERDFGIPIDHYAWVGLEGFVNVIDRFGGVDVDVMHPIVDDAYPDDMNTSDPYGSRRLYIPAGPQHLSGQTTLEYVRSRHGDLIGDFGRSQRQQQVLDALRTEVNGPALIPRIPELANSLKDSLRTDMTLYEIAKFASLADELKPAGVQRFALTPPRYAQESWSRDGQNIVIPNWTAIRPLVDQIFGLSTRSPG